MMKGYVRGLLGDEVEHIARAFSWAHSYHLKLNEFNSIQKTLIIQQGAILLWSGGLIKIKNKKLREQYNKHNTINKDLL